MRGEAASASPAPAAPFSERAAARPGSPLGLGFGLLRIALDAPRARVTEEPTIGVAGRILGGEASFLVLRVNGKSRAVSIDGRRFQVPVSLTPGPNRIIAVAMGPDGLEVEDAITIEYAPRTAVGGIALSSPRDGLVLGPDDPPVVRAEGRVEDPAVSRVWLVANDQAVAVAVRGGRFHLLVPVLQSSLSLSAEHHASDAPAHRSNTITVRRPELGPTGVLLLDWTGSAAGMRAEVGATWRAAPDRLDGPIVPVSLRMIPGPSGSSVPEGVYLRNFKPGVYTFTVRLVQPAPVTRVRPIVHFSGYGTAGRRALQPVPLDGKARVVLARILLPQGILWDDDEWTGQSESVDTITKFRLRDGITWVERRADLH